MSADASPGILPRHIAIIMDGNGRWAQSRGLPRIAGHRRGAEAVRRTLTAAAEIGIPYLTLFGFSSENWKRPPGSAIRLRWPGQPGRVRPTAVQQPTSRRSRRIDDGKAF